MSGGLLPDFAERRLSGGSTLSTKQQAAVLALLTEPSIEAAAKKARVGSRTIHYWLKNDPAFVDELRAARRRQA